MSSSIRWDYRRKLCTSQTQRIPYLLGTRSKNLHVWEVHDKVGKKKCSGLFPGETGVGLRLRWLAHQEKPRWYDQHPWYFLKHKYRNITTVIALYQPLHKNHQYILIIVLQMLSKNIQQLCFLCLSVHITEESMTKEIGGLKKNIDRLHSQTFLNHNDTGWSCLRRALQ